MFFGCADKLGNEIVSMLDNFSLFRVVEAIRNNTNLEYDLALDEYVRNISDFQILRDNSTLVDLLYTFLSLDRQVVQLRKQTLQSGKWRFLRKFKWKPDEKFEGLILKLGETLGSREEAFKKYEMYRRLACYDNPRLRVYLS